VGVGPELLVVLSEDPRPGMEVGEASQHRRAVEVPVAEVQHVGELVERGVVSVAGVVEPLAHGVPRQHHQTPAVRLTEVGPLAPGVLPGGRVQQNGDEVVVHVEAEVARQPGGRAGDHHLHLVGDLEAPGSLEALVEREDLEVRAEPSALLGAQLLSEGEVPGDERLHHGRELAPGEPSSPQVAQGAKHLHAFLRGSRPTRKRAF